MQSRAGTQLRAYRALLRLYPLEFQARFADEMVVLFGDQLRDARAHGPLLGFLRTWLQAIGDLASSAVAEHARRDRTMAHTLAVAPPGWARGLALLGVLGGLLLLEPFVLPLPERDLNQLRIILFSVGTMAVVIAVHGRQAAAGPVLAAIGAVPALVATASFLAMVVMAIGRDSPFSGDFGFVYFLAGFAMWLSHGWFGIVTLRLGALSRWGAAALAFGTAAALGMDRLELVTGPNGELFTALAQLGIALNGIGWVVLGLDLVIRRRTPGAAT
jgi:hypothetical protein